MGTNQAGVTGVRSGRGRAVGALALAFAVGGLAAVALDPTLVRARDDGALDFITRNAPASWRQVPERPAPVLAYAPVRAVDPFQRSTFPFGTSEGLEAERPRAAPTARPALRSGDMSHRRTVCVRMCDGFAFPSSDAGVSGGEAEQLQSCQSACPTATVKLFALPAGTDDLAQAASADGQRYGRLPMAFAFARQRDNACTCRGDAPGLAARTPFEDRTLRAGDIVVVDGKAQVFTGGERARHTLANFRDLGRASSLSATDRSRVDERLGLSQRAVAQRELQRLKAKSTGASATLARSPAVAAPERTSSTAPIRVIAGATSVPAR